MQRLICLLIALLFVSIAVHAQTAEICGGNERIAMYTDYYNKKKGDAATQKEAYEIAKQYLAKWPQCSDQYSQAVQKFIAAYEQATLDFDLRNAAFGSSPNYPQAIELGKKILANRPDDLTTLMIVAQAAFYGVGKGNTALTSDAINYTRNALQLIDAGRTVPEWYPFRNKDEAINVLNYSLGEIFYVVNKDKPGAWPFYLKAATVEGPNKKTAILYGRLAAIYELESEKLNTEYNKNYGGKPETDESKAALEKVNQSVDRLIDYYARAINLAGSDAKLTAAKTAWNDRLTELYKFRHNGTTEGMDTMIANALNNPLPLP